MALRQTLPRAQWNPAHFYNLNKKNKEKRISTVRRYPIDAILHWDADSDTYDSNAFTELTGGPHAFNHAVLSPQYQRNADGSYSNVGAKPAVDTFDGERWVRSCGAVKNLLPSGWPSSGISIVVSDLDGYKKLEKATTSMSASIADKPVCPAGSLYTATLKVRARNGVTGDRIEFGFYDSGFKPINVTAFLGPGSYSIASNMLLVFGLSTDEDTEISVTLTTAQEVDVRFNVYPCGVFSAELGASVLIKDFILTTTSYPVPYVPPGVTQPASNATTTNGMWFSLPDGSPLWQALTGQPLTLATRVRMGVGTGDIPATSDLGIISGRPYEIDVMYSGSRPGLPRIVRSYDGTRSVGYENVSWARNGIHRLVVQVNTAGTQFRVGYMIEGTHTAIQWSVWANYDGSFNLSTPYRLMLGYLNAYPMWFNKITAWKKQATDAEILEAMA